MHVMRTRTALIGSLLLSLIAASAWSTEAEVTVPPSEFKLDAFYEKHISASGYSIISSRNVSDYALKEAAYVVDLMLAERPDLRKAMFASGSLLIVISYNEFTTDIPEYSQRIPEDIRNVWDARVRGFGGDVDDPLCSCGEENLLGYAGDPYANECILIHEFAHNIHLRGLVRVDPTFDKRLKRAYDAAMSQGLWKGTYAAVNHKEYWAEAVQAWFDCNHPPNRDHNHVNSRRELKAYDAAVARPSEEVFGDERRVYTKPATRLTNHLAGNDPSKAPEFKWPARLAKVRDEMRRKQVDLAKEQPEESTIENRERESVDDAESPDLERAKLLLTKEMQEILDDTGTPSISIALMKDDRIVWTKALGHSNMKLKTPASPSTIYCTGSCFKPITTMAVMQLVDNGKINLDDPVNDYLGEHAIKDMTSEGHAVTIRHLLSHFSGLQLRQEGESLIARTKPLWGRELPKSLEKLPRDLTATSRPGMKYQYSNYGYALAGLLVEKVSGQSYEQYIVENILKPVGVTHAGPVDPTPAMIEELALPYRLEDHTAIPERQYRIDVFPAGDIYMSAPAMSKLLLLHLNAGRHNGVSILSEAAIIEMRTPQFGGKDGLDFGIRKLDDETLIMHGGQVPGYCTKFILGVDSKVGVYVASNANGVLPSLRVLSQMSIDLLRGKQVGTGLVRQIVHCGVTFAPDKETGLLRITAVAPKSPAGRADLSAGPLIKTINDVSVEGKTLKDCLALMAGPAGTKVRLQLVEPRKTVELLKQKYLVPS